MKTKISKRTVEKITAAAFGRQGGLIGGRAKSEAKAVAAKINGAKGGRPRLPRNKKGEIIRPKGAK